MKPRFKFALPLSCIPLILSNTSHATTVLIQTALSGSGAAPTTGLVPISTGAIRGGGQAPPTNVAVSGQITGAPSTTTSAPESSVNSQTPSSESNQGSSSSSSRAPRKGQAGSSTASGSSHAANSAKGAIPPEMAVVYDDPGALTITAEGGYATKHIWRGIDLAQFTSFNHLDVSGLPKADSDVCFVGASANYQGFSFGLKYITTLDDGFNPFFAPLTTTLDNP